MQTVGNRKEFFSYLISEIPNFSYIQKTLNVSSELSFKSCSDKKMPENMECMCMRRCACTFNYRSFNENLYQHKKNRDLHNTEFFLIKTIFKNLPVPVPGHIQTYLV